MKRKRSNTCQIEHCIPSCFMTLCLSDLGQAEVEEEEKKMVRNISLYLYKHQ